MDKKKYIISAAVICIVGSILFCFINKSQNKSVNANNTTVQQEEKQNTGNKARKNNKNNKLNQINTGIEKSSLINPKQNNETIVKTNLYSDLPSAAMPLSVMTEMSDLPENVQEIISDISNSNNIYMIHKHHNKLLIISDNPENIRHNIGFTEVTISNGHQIQTTLGYNDKMADSQNDIWEYNKENGQPLRHTKYNEDGNVDFVEVWNYDPENPVKYEMKDSEGRVISMRNETLTNGTDLRIEHLVYDKNGNTKINVSTTYEGDDIKRFTYYNADKLSESGSVFSDYTDGQKTKETVYTSDLKLKNTYTSDYKDGERENIIIFDNNNQEIKKFVQSEEK